MDLNFVQKIYIENSILILFCSVENFWQNEKISKFFA